MTGFEIERRLHRESIYPEMATLQHLLFLVTPGTTDEDVERVLAALAGIVETPARRVRRAALPPPPLPQLALNPREAKFARKRLVPVSDALGEISGETIATYPPGAPLIAAGEIVSAEVLEYLRCMRANGAVLKGASDPEFETLKVLAV